jgi:hypothetical protein
LPLLPGDRVRLEARLNQPAHAYLVWIDGEGRAKVLYPRRGDGLEGPRDPAEPRQSVASPEAFDDAWPVTGPGGLETALLLARRTTLPPGVDLAEVVGRVPPVSMRDPQEVTVHAVHEGEPVEALAPATSRGLGATAVKLDDPLLRLMAKLRPRFEVICSVRFAYRGEPAP